MKPKLQKELEQLVEAQDLEAEQEALITDEIKAVAEFSLKENIRSEIKGVYDIKTLVDLVDEKGRFEDQQRLYPTCESGNSYKSKVEYPVLGAAGGLLAGISLLNQNSLLVFIPVTIGLGIGKAIGFKKHKKWQQEYQQKVKDAQQQLENITEQLSLYQTDYHTNDLVLAYQSGSGYEGKYSILYGHNVGSAVTVAAVLEPREYLTEEKIKALENGTPIACYTKEDTLLNYGFLYDALDTEFSLSLDRTLFQSKEYYLNFKKCYTFNELREEEITTRLLVPVREEVQTYRIGAR